MAVFDPTSPEAWYPVPGFPAYEISSHLRLRSWHQGPKRRRQAPRIIKVHSDNRGYRKLVLWRDGKYHNLYLHRVVAELAFGPCPDGLQVLHRDDDKANNWPSNLYFGTQAQNVADCKANGHFVTLRGEQRPSVKLNELAVKAIRRLDAYGVDRGVLAECFGLDRSSVLRVLTGERWAHIQ